jgi:SAM-dependent methyltransferase
VHGRLLDLGCNDKPYKPYLGDLCDEWVGYDRADYYGRPTQADVLGDILDLRFEPRVFDTVLCTQVLGDVARSDLLFEQCFRVLKEGGHLILSASQYDSLHDEPDDYYRFTKYGLTALAEGAGLQVLRTLPVGGAAALVGRVLCSHTPLLNRDNRVSRVMSALVQHLFYRLDRRWFRPRDPIGWVIVCRKGPTTAIKRTEGVLATRHEC